MARPLTRAADPAAEAPYKLAVPPAVAQHLASHRSAHQRCVTRQNRGERGSPAWEMTAPLDVIRREIELCADALHRHPPDADIAENLGHLSAALASLHTAYSRKISKQEVAG
jgi:hypothetical protein